jgi:hypothetical protein
MRVGGFKLIAIRTFKTRSGSYVLRNIMVNENHPNQLLKMASGVIRKQLKPFMRDDEVYSIIKSTFKDMGITYRDHSSVAIAKY